MIRQTSNTLLFFIPVFLLLACQNKPEYLSKNYSFRPAIIFSESPKLMQRNCHQMDTVLMQFRPTDHALNYPVEIIFETQGALIKQLTDYRSSGQRIAIPIPVYGKYGQDQLALTASVYKNDRLIDRDTLWIEYLKDGEVRTTYDYQFPKGKAYVKCGRPQYYENEVMHRIPGSEEFLLDMTTTYHTYKENDQIIVAVSSSQASLQSRENRTHVDLPQIPDTTFVYPGDLRIRLGKQQRQLCGYFNTDKIKENAYAAHTLRKDAIAFQKQLRAVDCGWKLVGESCPVYIPFERSFRFLPYPEQLANDYR